MLGNKMLNAKFLQQDYRYHKLDFLIIAATIDWCLNSGMDQTKWRRAFRNQNYMSVKFVSANISKIDFLSVKKYHHKFQTLGYNINVMLQSAYFAVSQLWLITLLPSFIACWWDKHQTQL